MKHSRYNRVAALALILLLVLTGGGSAFCASLSSARAGSASGEAMIALGSGIAASTDTKEIPKINAIMPGGPAISGKAGIVMEVHSGAILFAKNATESYMPMSLTKLMTALLVLEDGNMTDTVRCSYTAINGIGSKVTRVGLVADERVSVRDMLYASLVASADEATYALGEHVGGSSRKFIKMMNERMAELGGVNTTFSSITGTGGTKQLSCAYDMGLVACELGCRGDFLEIAGAKWYKIPATNLKEARTIAQTHKFIRQTLKYNYAIAGKSGGQMPDNGGFNLCTYAEKDGMRLVAIVMGSASDEGAYDDTISMLNYSFENYVCYSMKGAEKLTNKDYAGFFDICPMFTGKDHETVYTDASATIVVPHGADMTKLEKRVEYDIPDDYVHGPNVIGHLIYSYQGTPIGSTDILYYNEEFPLSQKDFNAVWPKFLLSPSLLESVGGPGTGTVVKLSGTKKATPTPTPLPNSIVRWEGTGKKEAGIKAGLLFGGLFLVLLVVIYIVLPMVTIGRRSKKTLRRR